MVGVELVELGPGLGKGSVPFDVEIDNREKKRKLMRWLQELSRHVFSFSTRLFKGGTVLHVHMAIEGSSVPVVRWGC